MQPYLLAYEEAVELGFQISFLCIWIALMLARGGIREHLCTHHVVYKILILIDWSCQEIPQIGRFSVQLVGRFLVQLTLRTSLESIWIKSYSGATLWLSFAVSGLVDHFYFSKNYFNLFSDIQPQFARSVTRLMSWYAFIQLTGSVATNRKFSSGNLHCKYHTFSEISCMH